MLIKLFLDDMIHKLSHIYVTRKVQECVKTQIQTYSAIFSSFTNRLNQKEKEKYKESIDLFNSNLRQILEAL